MSQNLKHLNESNFTSEVAEGVTLVDFYADWCGPCRMIAPLVEELADEMNGRAKIAKLDIESAQGIASNLGITSIPTLILFKNGKEMERIIGVRDMDTLKKTVESAL